tara:strand:- start:592 stop:894 length:303 start_codon:yes stop_codon:yes gene_type:complete
MSDDFDYKAEKDAEMLADYYSDLATEQIQENCHHEDIHIDDVRVRVKLPIGVFTSGQVVEEHNFDVEGYFVCYQCNKSRWVSIDIDEYIMNIDDPHVLDD